MTTLLSGEDRIRRDCHNTLQDIKLGNTAAVGAAAGAAIEGENALIDPDLAMVVHAWPTLRAETRAAIIAMIQREGGDA
jgi:hypothetical protein